MLKNWVRVFYIMLCATGVIMYTLLLAIMPKGVASFSLVCFILAPMAFFIGTIAYNILAGLDGCKSVASYVQLATGLLSTLLFGLAATALFNESKGIANIISNDLTGNTDHAQFYAQMLVTFAYFGQMIVFALMPLLKGINKVFINIPISCDELKSTVQTPIPAPAIETIVVAEKPKRTTTPRTTKPKPVAEEAAPEPTPAPVIETQITEIQKSRKPRHR